MTELEKDAIVGITTSAYDAQAERERYYYVISALKEVQMWVNNYGR